MDNLEERLREQRPELNPVELDRIKFRAMRAARSKPRRTVKRSRLTVALAVAMIAVGSGGAIALNGGLTTHVGNAANAQYGQNGENGQNGQNGAPGQNGQGQNTQTTIVTVNIPPAAPLPGSATPTKTKHRQIRVCRRYAHRSVKFHGHVFHPKTCWYRFV
jgi:hypothetical protein